MSDMIDTDETWQPVVPSPVRYLCCSHCTHPDRIRDHVTPCNMCIAECPHPEVEAEVERDGEMAPGIYRVTLHCHRCDGRASSAISVHGLRWDG